MMTEYEKKKLIKKYEKQLFELQIKWDGIKADIGYAYGKLKDFRLSHSEAEEKLSYMASLRNEKKKTEKMILNLKEKISTLA